MSSDDPTTSLHTPWDTTVEPPTAVERELMEQRYQVDQLRLLGSAVHVSHHGIAILTPAVEAVGPRIAFVNDGFCTMYGRDREEVIGQTIELLGIVDRHAQTVRELLDHVFDRLPFSAEATARRKDGTEFELDLDLVPVQDDGQLTHWVAFLRDVTDAKTQVVRLRHQAMHDPLTELPNRAMLFDSLEKLIDHARESNTM